MLQIVLVLCVFTSAYGESVVPEMTFNAVFNLINETCNSTLTPLDYQEFLTVAVNGTTCIVKNAGKTPIFLTPVDVFKKDVDVCFNTSYNLENECLESNLNDWIGVILNVTFSFLDFIYKNEQTLRSREFDNFIVNCTEEIYLNGVEDEFLGCFSKYNFDFGADKLDKKVLCKALIGIELCAMDFINARCSFTESSMKLKADLIMTLRELCSEYLVTETSQEDNIGGLFTLLA